MKTKYAELGSVSCATLRPEDLIPAFLDTLRELGGVAPAGIDERMYTDDGDYVDGYFDSEEAGWDLESLESALQEFAPPFCYFGAHEGDGADFGFWFSSDSFEDACRYGECLKLNAGDEWPALDADVQYVAEVTDHGNLTIFTRDHVEVLSIV